MKFHNISVPALSVLLALFVLVACKKDHDGGTPPPAPSGMKINLSYPAYPSNFELIISEPGGKVLLDTLSPFINNITATLNTKQTLLDLTLISYDSIVNKYNTTTYKGIDPSKWTSVVTSNYVVPYGTASSQNATIFYTHVPIPDDYFLADDFVGSNNLYANNFTPGVLGLNYTQHAGNNYLYLILPIPGLYNFHIPKGLADTVDLANNMDTAVRANFNIPAQYNRGPVRLNGILDTTNFSKSVALWNDISHLTGWPDVEYPTKLVQKMELTTSATNSNNDYVTFYSYGDTVPRTLPFPDETSYTLSSVQNTNFTVKFTSVHPSYYRTIWNSGNCVSTFYASPDSANLNPVALLSSLKSKKLQGQDLTGLALSTFGFESAYGLDCPGFFSYTCNPDLIKTRRMPLSTTFTKTF